MTMSGETAARALASHFDEIRRAELARLQKKLASLSPSDRAEVEAIAARVVDALAAEPARALARDGSPVLAHTLVDAFRIVA
jgi:glutamyl-tRNA reductase